MFSSGINVAVALAGFLSLLLVHTGWSGEKEVDLVGTTGSPPAGWDYYGLGGEYADGSLKLDHDGDYVVTESFDGIVTMLTVELKGNSASGGTALEVIPSVDRINWDESKKQRFVLPDNTKRSESFEFDPEDGFVAFKLVIFKKTGNIGLYTVKAVFFEAGELPAPVALAATEVSEDGFTANWSASWGATSYLLDIYYIVHIGGLSEDFSGFMAGEPNGSASNAEVTSALDSYTTVSGWSGSYIYQAGGSVKLGKGSELGQLTTPELDLSGNGGNFTVSFDACAWSNDANTVKLYLLNSGETAGEVVQVGIPNDGSYTFEAKSYNFSGGTSRSAIRLEGAKKINARFFIDNLVIAQEGVSASSQQSFVVKDKEVAATSYQVEVSEPWVYYYQVWATDGELISDGSNIVMVDTSAEPEPDPDPDPDPDYDTIYAIEIKGKSGVYTQDFDELASSGTPVWVNYAEPLPGWSAFIAQNPASIYRTGAGTTATGGIYSWGSGADRALGSLATAGNEYTFGVAFSNTTDMVVTNLQVSFSASQWRVANTNAHTLYFDYAVAEQVYPLHEESAVEWVAVEGLCFESPLQLSGVDGDKARAINHSEHPECVVSLSANLVLELPPDGVVMLRWRDPYEGGSYDHAFGIDNLRVGWQAQVKQRPTVLMVY